MSIVLEQLTKRYEGHPVVNHVSLEIADGELFVLLGPSGSGKSTVLRMIAGLTRIDEGRVVLHGRDVTTLPPQQRGTGFVFQHYALFQHMTVAENVEFALRIRHASAAERRKRRDELLELVGLAGLGIRMPAQLSGGQQQRIALARALAHRPDVLLLDEPFGALDAKIRVELRRALRSIQAELGMTTVFVTHDQEEAYELADRLGVMNFGRLLEVGPPEELYQRPQTEFVATFLGTANLLVGRATSTGVQVGPVHFPLNTVADSAGAEQRVQVLFRTEDVVLAASPERLGCPQLGQGEVEQTTFAGSIEKLRLRLPSLPGVRPISPLASFGDNAILVEAMRSQDLTHRFPLRSGDKVWIGVRRVHALAHPGLSFLFVTDGSPQARAALTVGGQIARMAHARVTILGYKLPEDALRRHLQELKEQLGSGLASLELRATPDDLLEAVTRETERQSFDLVVLGGTPRKELELAEALMQSGHSAHHMLLVPGPQPTPACALICVASGEPGKADVLFAGRLIRHLGAQATLLSVMPPGADALRRDRTERFLASGIRSLEALGVPAKREIRVGPVHEEIRRELTKGNHDLLVLGAPLADREGKRSFDGVTGQILRNMPERAVLVVRSSYTSASVPLLMPLGRLNLVEEDVP